MTPDWDQWTHYEVHILFAVMDHNVRNEVDDLQKKKNFDSFLHLLNIWYSVKLFQNWISILKACVYGSVNLILPSLRHGKH